MGKDEKLMADTVELKTKGLDQFIKSLKGKLPTVRVGILGSHDARRGGVNGNAEIGAKHEFGGDGMPIRSFLRVPISENIGSYLENYGAFDEDNLKKVINEGKLSVWMKQIGIVAEKIVGDAFSNGGFGKWPGWKGNYKSNTGLILVDTTQLRNSITSEVHDG
jgi:hypothetical protein